MEKTTPHHYETFGIQCWQGNSAPMERIHSHTEIELNLIEKGEVHYRFGSKEQIFKAGGLYAFIGLEPHQLTYTTPDTKFSWLTIPMSYFTGWNLSVSLANRILSGEIVRDEEPQEIERDGIRFKRWIQDLDRDDPRYLRVIMLEVQARLERMALGQKKGPSKQQENSKQTWSTPVARMTACILQNLTNPDLSMKYIAESAHLNPSYASTLFSRKTGETPITFLTRQRLAYARFILATTDSTVLDTALSSGFGSSSQFYASFKKYYGVVPTNVRKLKTKL